MEKTYSQPEDVLSYHLLKQFIPEHIYLPYTSSSLSFQSLRIIINDLAINGRCNILEFGSGISSFILSNALSEFNSGGQIWSIDESAEWIDILKKIAKKEFTNLNFVHASISEKDNWYEWEALKDIPKNIDLVIVDGPSAWQKERKKARSGALNFLVEKNILKENDYAIFLDDCNRPDELKMLTEWSEALNCRKRELSPTLGILSPSLRYNLV